MSAVHADSSEQGEEHNISFRSQQSTEDFDSGDNILSLASSMDSLPLLASPEPQSYDWTSNDGRSSGSDSGVVEEVGGNVTDLCRRRRRHEIRRGVIT